MNSHKKIITSTRLVGSIVLFLGITIFLYGFVNGFSPITGVGIGTVTGAIFIFLIGMFFVATEEMVEKTFKGIEINSAKGVPLFSKKD